MDVYGWLFKLYARFCEWQLSGKNILFFLLSIGQLAMPNFFPAKLCLQWYQQNNTAYRIQVSACLKSCKGSQLYNRFRS